MRVCLAVIVCLAIALPLPAQTYSTDFDSYKKATPARDLQIAGMSFSSLGNGYIVTDASSLVFSLLKGMMLAAGDNSVRYEWDETPLTIVFSSPVDTFAFDYYADFGRKGESIALDATAFAGSTPVAAAKFTPAVLRAFPEGHGEIASVSTPFDRVILVLHYSFGTTRGPYAIDNVTASRKSASPAVINGPTTRGGTMPIHKLPPFIFGSGGGVRG